MLHTIRKFSRICGTVDVKIAALCRLCTSGCRTNLPPNTIGSTLHLVVVQVCLALYINPDPLIFWCYGDMVKLVNV